jgi:hypothetical protein
VKAIIKAELTASSGEAAQRILLELCSRMMQQGLVHACSFEIEAPEGIITDRCVLSEGKIIA